MIPTLFCLALLGAPADSQPSPLPSAPLARPAFDLTGEDWMIQSSPSAKPSDFLTSSPDSAHPAQDTTPVMAKDLRPVTALERWGRSPLQWGAGMLGGLSGSAAGALLGGAVGGVGGLILGGKCDEDNQRRTKQVDCMKGFISLTTGGAVFGAALLAPAGAGQMIDRSSSTTIRSDDKAIAILGSYLGAIISLGLLKIGNGGSLDGLEILPAGLVYLAGTSLGGVLMDRNAATRTPRKHAMQLWNPAPGQLGLLSAWAF